jgi:hypothetical protein
LSFILFLLKNCLDKRYHYNEEIGGLYIDMIEEVLVLHGKNGPETDGELTTARQELLKVKDTYQSVEEWLGGLRQEWGKQEWFSAIKGQELDLPFDRLSAEYKENKLRSTEG